MSSQLRRTTRGFTLIELAITFFVLGLLTTATFVSMTSVRDRAQEADAQMRLRGVAAAQNFLFEARGYFTADQAELTALENAYLYTVDDTPAPLDSKQVSVSVVVLSSEQVVGMATYSPNGRCHTLRMAEPSSAVPDAKVRFTTGDPMPCSGTTAIAQTTADGW